MDPPTQFQVPFLKKQIPIPGPQWTSTHQCTIHKCLKFTLLNPGKKPENLIKNHLRYQISLWTWREFCLSWSIKSYPKAERFKDTKLHYEIQVSSLAPYSRGQSRNGAFSLTFKVELRRLPNTYALECRHIIIPALIVREI
jgi:hypothetical protein